MTPPTHNDIGFWKRFGATVVDTILLSILLLPLLIWIYGSAYLDVDQTGFVSGPADFIISWIVPIFIVIGFWIWKQVTPGKMAIKAKIVDTTTGEKPTLKQWILRYIGYFVSLIPLGLGYLWVAFDKRKQGWHDKIAGTVVVKSSK